MRATQALGQYGEDVAARFLRDAGYEVIERNWRSSERAVPGEIDIVARSAECLVFCEVKTRRSSQYGSPAEAVTPIKAARIRRLAAIWLRDHKVHAHQIRIDVIAVSRPPAGAASIEHLRGVA